MAETKARFIAGNFTTTGKPADVSGATGSSEGLIVYSTIDDLPTTNLTSGDQAFVSASSRLYISNGSGWYNVALINATPSLTVSPSGTIELSTEGVAQIVTITAADSDNADASLTLSADSGGDFFKMATVSQDSSVFTITPRSKDSATSLGFDGTATLTFKASDGISFGTETSTFTLAFSIPNSNLTSLLIKADTAGTDNQVDASTNALTITEYGNTTSTAFSPYHPGGYSNYITSSGSGYVEWTSSPTFSATAWCVETWFKPNGMPSVAVGTAGHWSIFGCWTANTNNREFLLIGGSSGKLRFYYSFDGSTAAYVDTASGVFSDNTWVHLAVSFDGTNYTVYADGVNVARVVNSTQIANKTAPLAFGKSIDGAGAVRTYVTGWYADGRVINGSTLESSNTFPVPTSRIDYSVANTQALMHHLPHKRQAVTYNGDATIKRAGPYDYIGYAKADHGGSVYFDGTGDYIQTPNGTYMNYGSDNFTFECWIYPLASNGDRYIVSDYTSAGQMASASFHVLLDDGILKSYVRVGGVNVIGGLNGSTTVQLNVWHHVALVRNGNVFTLYLNGASEATVTQSGSMNVSNEPFTIGRGGNYAGLYTQGYIADARLVKGTAVYTSNFAAPTAPLTAITNTQLLTCTNKNNIWDTSSGTVLTKAGNTTASNTQRKFATSSAMYFDGTGDFISSPTSQTFDLAGSIAWTIEGWFYWSSLTGEQTLVEKFTGGTGPGWTLYKLSSNALGFYSGSSVTFSNTIGTVTSGQWYHVAITRDAGGTTRGFLNGTLNASGTYSIGNNSTGNLYIGSRNGSANYMNGYVQDVRITKGLARYTSAFTPTTTEHKA